MGDATVEPRVTMNNIIQEISVTGKTNLSSSDHFDRLDGVSEQPVALQRVVEVLAAEPENKLSQIKNDKYIMQRGYASTSYIYLANGKK